MSLFHIYIFEVEIGIVMNIYDNFDQEMMVRHSPTKKNVIWSPELE